MLNRVLFMALLLSALCCNMAMGKSGIVIGGVNLKAFDGDSEPYGDFKVLTVPIKRAGNLIIVEAQLDSVAGNFVLDTGAPYLILNSTYFRDLPKIIEQDAGGVNGRASGTFTAVVHNFSLGFDLHYDRLVADVTDLSGIENSKKIKILGLLGTRLFAKLAITIDLSKNLLYIHKLDKNNDILPDERVFDKPDMKTTFKYMNDVIFIKGNVTDKSIWFAFDTGAETNMLDLHVPKKVIKSLQVINRSNVVGVGGSSYEMIYAHFDKLVIGDYPFVSNRVLVSNLENIGKAYGYSVDGILGYDFFARGIFSINFAKKEFEMYIYNHQ
ncbi:aspartyl protease family protein [Mucilaginibacter jinjuensis]|uniref:Aspartyl protease family protein n=1 Tax=Mucilaginibacter jinjuensis TaxID=1176721 RepID=A0ABY7T2U7_9SPHI|nr:aspartyl protease family protein [Mucilaginibacter jinjuensis]WCT10510.1 aspartyl protease family protein [Mucilaginibacter jinjuensis]